jgi:hypothetical protein
MGISVTTSPRIDGNNIGIHASHTGIKMILESDATGSGAGFAMLLLRMIAPIAVGSKAVINGITWTAADDPGAYQFMASTHPVAPTAAQIARDFCNRLAAEPVLRLSYIFECNTNVIGMFAIHPGSVDNITATYTPTSNPSGPFEQVSNTAGANEFDGQQYANYRAYCQIETNPYLVFPSAPSVSTGWQTASKQYLDYSVADNQHVFDLSSATQAVPERTNITASIGFQNLGGLLAYRVRYGEAYTPASQTNRIELEAGVTQVFWACESVLAVNTPNDLRPYYQTSAVRQWFTSRPPTKTAIHVDGILPLCFLYYNPSAPSARYLAVSIMATFTDGSTLTAGEKFKALAIEGFVGVRVDPQAWGMSAFEATAGKPVRSYTCTLVQSTTLAFTSFTAISAAHEVVVDRKTEMYATKTLVWQEPLGGFSAFTFTGDTGTARSRETASFRRNIPVENTNKAAYGASDATVAVVVSIELTTGLITPEVHEWLAASLCLSRRVYLLDNDSKELTACNIAAIKAEGRASDLYRSLSLTVTASIQQSALPA